MTFQPPNLTNQRMSPEILYNCQINGSEGDIIVWNYEPTGEVIFYTAHESAMEKMQRRIDYLENILDEYMVKVTD